MSDMESLEIAIGNNTNALRVIHATLVLMYKEMGELRGDYKENGADLGDVVQRLDQAVLSLTDIAANTGSSLY